MTVIELLCSMLIANSYVVRSDIRVLEKTMGSEMRWWEMMGDDGSRMG